jgi:hypothetical protein
MCIDQSVSLSNFPLGHFEQTPEAVDDVFFPSPQAVQVDAPSFEKFPAAQLTQSFCESCRAASVRSSERYFPTAHPVQMVVVIVDVNRPEGQTSQRTEASVSANLPLAQLTHDELPAWSEASVEESEIALPGGQFSQLFEFGPA